MGLLAALPNLLRKRRRLAGAGSAGVVAGGLLLALLGFSAGAPRAGWAAPGAATPGVAQTQGARPAAAQDAAAAADASGDARRNSKSAAAPERNDERADVTYFIATGNERSGYRVSDSELALWALQAWQRSAGKGIRLTAAAEPDALVRLYWAESNAGEFGEMQPVLVGRRQGAAVYIQPDVSALGPEIGGSLGEDPLLRESVVYLTCLHEFGHALGLGHTRDFRDIMYSFTFGGDVAEYFARYRSQIHTRADIARVSGLSDADVARIRMLYPAR